MFSYTTFHTRRNQKTYLYHGFSIQFQISFVMSVELKRWPHTISVYILIKSFPSSSSFQQFYVCWSNQSVTRFVLRCKYAKKERITIFARKLCKLILSTSVYVCLKNNWKYKRKKEHEFHVFFCIIVSHTENTHRREIDGRKTHILTSYFEIYIQIARK